MNKKKQIIAMLLCCLPLLTIIGLFAVPKAQKDSIKTAPVFSQLAEAVEYINKNEGKIENMRSDNEKKFFIYGDNTLVQGALGATGFDPKPTEQGPSTTELGIVYIPGFSATRREISPVVENVAQKLNSNLFMSRLSGHGTEPEGISRAKAEDFLSDGLEAAAVSRVLGKKKIWIATSTGALVTLWVAAHAPENIDALILVSPAFDIKPSYSWISAGYLGPAIGRVLIGPQREWTPLNPEQKKYWHTRYGTAALTQLTRLIAWTKQIDLTKIKTPVLVFYTDNDETVNVDLIKKRFEEFGSVNKQLIKVNATNHILAGTITSPETTEFVTEEMLKWIKHFLEDFR